MDSTATETLEEAFGKLTGIRDATQSSTDFLAALEKA
jgi:hypothetical protein